MKLGIIRGGGEDAFRYVKDHSLDFIEQCSNFDPDSEAFIASKDEAKALIEKYGVPILSVGRWNAEVVKDGKLNADTVALLKQDATTQNVKIMIGGAPANPDVATEMGANYSADASAAVDLAVSLVS